MGLRGGHVLGSAGNLEGGRKRPGAYSIRRHRTVEFVQWISQQAVKAIYATAKNAKIRLRPMISVGRAEPVAVAKRGRPVVVVMAVEEFERLTEVEARMKTDQSDQATERHD